jgi:serine/threonine-protein kinase
VSDPKFPSTDSELTAHVERVLSDSYELDREIDRGGMGIVYLARDKRLKRPVAVKLLPPELAFRSDIRTRFLREAETAAQLNHPNIVPIYAVDEREGLVYFVMGFVDGENLAARLHRAGAMTSAEVRRMMIDVAGALAYAHSCGVVHRDIKPDNILLDSSGRIMVTDFGIARAMTQGSDTRLTATGMAIGTPAYMSPEQTTGEKEVDGRSDLYSLGIVGYQMLTGELPFNASSTPALLVKQLSEAPPPIQERCPSVDRDLGRAIMILLEKDPEHRFADANAMVTALETGTVPDLPAVSRRTLGNTGRTAQAAADGGRSQALVYHPGEPTAEEVARWEQPEVKEFRRKLVPWAYAGVASVVLAALNILDLVGVWGIWTVFVGWRFAKLWTNGFDWRDVLREPRDRMFFDVAADQVEGFKAIWDPSKRELVRERDRERRRLLDGVTGTHREGQRGLRRRSGRGVELNPPAVGKFAQVVADARRDRDDLIRMLGTLSKQDRDLLNDLPATADSLYQRIEQMAGSLSSMDGIESSGSLDEVDEEIATLESQANPLDVAGSETRVRRLAQLKRERRALADVDSRSEGLRSKLESCSLALRNMRLDVLRLKSGPQTYESITLVAEKAASVARDVDNAMYVRDEMAKLGGR